MIIKPLVPPVVSMRRGALASGEAWDGDRGAGRPPTLAQQILALAPGLVQRMQLSPAPGTGLTTADCYSLVSGAAETWIDLSGRGRHYLQATSTKRLTYSATAINSLPGLTAGGDDVMITASYDLSAMTWLAHICLWTDSVTGALVVAERSANGATSDGGHYISVNEAAGTVRFANRGAAVLASAQSTAKDMSTPAVVTGTHDQSLAALEAVIRINGVDATASRPHNFDTSGGFGNHADHIGGRSTGPSSPITGAFAADILLAGTGGLGAPQLAQIAAIEALLITTWGIT